MLGKIIAYGDSRSSALARMRTALAELVIDGIKTNARLHQDILDDAAFAAGGLTIHYLETRLGR
jgi:acetyl-CoA carboxylase biotin carboxylase subunit